jgi:hypothetical protein
MPVYTSLNMKMTKLSVDVPLVQINGESVRRPFVGAQLTLLIPISRPVRSKTSCIVVGEFSSSFVVWSVAAYD